MADDLIKEMLDRIRNWPTARRLEAAQALMDIEEAEVEEYDLTEEQYAQLDDAIGAADRGEFATDEEVRAVFARYRR
jgi:predicted transcriptional regulator